MCKFFSFCSNGRGAILYLNWEDRQLFLKDQLEIESPDSHTSILDYHKIDIKNHDKWNKYEFNPLTREFSIDTINTKEDSEQMENWVKALNFKKIIKSLIIKPIINPFIDRKYLKINEKDIELLEGVGASVGASVWASVRASVRDSVRASVWASVGNSVGASVGASVRVLVGTSVWNSVWDSVWDSVGASVGDSVWALVWASVGNSVRASVGDSVWDSVRASVWNSVGAYVSSFFKLKKWKNIKHEYFKNLFQCCIDLWEKGIVTSYDDTTWRLHGYQGKILWEDKGGINVK